MRKNKVLTIVPNLKEVKKSLKNKQRDLGRLSKEVLELESTINDVDGVTIYNEFPLLVLENDADSFEVISGCDDTSRYAVATEQDGRWSVRAYKSEGSADGQTIAENLTRLHALRTAKDFVSTGKTGVKGKVGRPRKNANANVNA